ncbi:hypothetical protein ACI2KR_31980 [Pseudomonas luteola]
MIRITIEMIPKGVGTPRHLGTINIANDGTGTPERGNYKVKLAKFGKPEGTWMRGVVKNFCRKTKGPYDLLLQALIATVGDRNMAVLNELKEEGETMADGDKQKSLF